MNYKLDNHKRKNTFTVVPEQPILYFRKYHEFAVWKEKYRCWQY